MAGTLLSGWIADPEHAVESLGLAAGGHPLHPTVLKLVPGGATGQKRKIVVNRVTLVPGKDKTAPRRWQANYGRTLVEISWVDEGLYLWVLPAPASSFVMGELVVDLLVWIPAILSAVVYQQSWPWRWLYTLLSWLV